MNSPILVWMLYLNREVTTEVSTLFLRHRHTPFHLPRPRRFFLLFLNRLHVKEYEKCYELVHNTVPHAKNIPSNPTSGESLRPLSSVSVTSP